MSTPITISVSQPLDAETNLFSPPKTFSNGMKLTIVHTGRDTPHVNKVAVAVAIKHGSSDDYGKGTAHLLEHMLFHGGGKMVGNKGIWYVAERAGVLMNAMTWNDGTMYYYIGESQDVYNMMSWLHAHVTDPKFATKDAAFDMIGLETERVVVVNEEEISSTRVMGTIREELMSLVFSATEYGRGIGGNRFEVLGTRVEDLKRFYDTYYRPSEAHMFVVGDIDPSYFTEITNQCNKTFGTWAPLPMFDNVIPRNLKIQPVQTGVRRSVVRTRGMYGAVMIGFQLPPAISESIHAMTCFDLLFMNAKQGSPLYTELATLGAIESVCSIEALANASILTFTVVVPAIKLFTGATEGVVSSADNIVEYDTPVPAKLPSEVEIEATPEDLKMFTEKKTTHVLSTTPLLRNIENRIAVHLAKFSTNPYEYLSKHSTIVAMFDTLNRLATTNTSGTVTVPIGATTTTPVKLSLLFNSEIIELTFDATILNDKTPAGIAARNKIATNKYVEMLITARNSELRTILETPMRLVEMLGFSWVNGDMLNGIAQFSLPTVTPKDAIFEGKTLTVLEQMQVVVAVYCKQETKSVVSMIPEDINNKSPKLIVAASTASDTVAAKSMILSIANRARIEGFSKERFVAQTSSETTWKFATATMPGDTKMYACARVCKSRDATIVITIPGFMKGLGVDARNSTRALFVSKFVEAIFNNATLVESAASTAGVRGQLTLTKSYAKIQTKYSLSLRTGLSITCTIEDAEGIHSALKSPVFEIAAAIITEEFRLGMTAVCTQSNFETYIKSYAASLHTTVIASPTSRATAIAFQELAPMAPSTQNIWIVNGFVASDPEFVRLIGSPNTFSHEDANTLRKNVSLDNATITVVCPPGQLAAVINGEQKTKPSFFFNIGGGFVKVVTDMNPVTQTIKIVAENSEAKSANAEQPPSAPVLAGTPAVFNATDVINALYKPSAPAGTIFSGREIANTLMDTTSLPLYARHDNEEEEAAMEHESDYLDIKVHVHYANQDGDTGIARGNDNGKLVYTDKTNAKSSWEFVPKYKAIVPKSQGVPRSCDLFIDRNTEYTPSSFVVVAKRIRGVKNDPLNTGTIAHLLAADIGSGFSGRVNTVVRQLRGNSYTVRNMFQFIDPVDPKDETEAILISTATCNPINVPNTIRAILDSWSVVSTLGAETKKIESTHTIQGLIESISTTTDLVIVHELVEQVSNNNNQKLTLEEELDIILDALSPYMTQKFSMVLNNLSSNREATISGLVNRIRTNSTIVTTYIRNFILGFTSEIGRAKFRRIKALAETEYGLGATIMTLDTAMDYIVRQNTRAQGTGTKEEKINKMTYSRMLVVYSTPDDLVNETCNTMYDAHQRTKDTRGRTAVVVSTSYPSASRDIPRRSISASTIITDDTEFEKSCTNAAFYIPDAQNIADVINEMHRHDHVNYSY